MVLGGENHGVSCRLFHTKKHFLERSMGGRPAPLFLVQRGAPIKASRFGADQMTQLVYLLSSAKDLQ